MKSTKTTVTTATTGPTTGGTATGTTSTAPTRTITSTPKTTVPRVPKGGVETGDGSTAQSATEPQRQLLVARKDGLTLTFVVTRVQEIDKDEFPSDAVYGGTPDPQLRLITCGGTFDRSVHSYRDNIIVYIIVYAKLTP